MKNANDFDKELSLNLMYLIIPIIVGGDRTIKAVMNYSFSG
ncbi:hypothetical protein [Nostoc sp. WHI]|nr:hypothetical protein [Nostoc sp. WHI]